MAVDVRSNNQVNTRLGQDVYPRGVVANVESQSESSWQPSHMLDPPQPPPHDTREQELAQLAAQEKLGHDGKRQRVRARRTVDPFGGLERWKIVSSSTTGTSKILITNPAC